MIKQNPLLKALGLGVCLLSFTGEAATRVVPKDQEQLSYAPLVKNILPSVVNVYASSVNVTPSGFSLFNDPFFKDFFDIFPQMPQTRQTLGSGVIISQDGLIITNHHVIKKATDIQVIMHDGQEHAAEILLSAPSSDLVVLKLKNLKKPLSITPLTLADTDKVEVGDIVLAIGNPFGVGQTVTSGIVSGLSRTGILSKGNIFIQTDAAINPGNSGGPLIDMQGKLLGINTAIVSRSGGSQGIGFAIPSVMIKKVLEAVKNKAKFLIYPWTGLGTFSLSSEKREELDYPFSDGVGIKAVAEDSPGQKAGIQKGDILQSFGSYEKVNEDMFLFRVKTSNHGERVPVKIWREGKILKKVLEMKLPPLTKDDTKVLKGKNNPLAGIRVKTLSPRLIQQKGLSYAQVGILIVGLTEEAVPIARQLASEDIIISVNGETVSSVKALEAELTKQEKKRNWEIRIIRAGQVLNYRFRKS